MISGRTFCSPAELESSCLFVNMADSTSDSGSVQSLQTDQGTEKKAEVTRFYALYSFYPNRAQTTEGVTATESREHEDGSLSLNVVATNLAAATETDLRKSLAHKLSKSAQQKGGGNFFSIGLNTASTAPEVSTSASCYYCQIQSTSDSLGFDHVVVEDKMENSSGNDCQQFVVCFISFQDSSLDLFRPELDQYAQGLVPLLDKEPFVPSSSLSPPSSSDTTQTATSPAPDTAAETGELSQLSTGIQAYLQDWPLNVLEYLTRTLQYMGQNIQQLIYAALLNATLQISGATSQQEEDVKRFFKCCSLSTLLDQLQPDNASITGSGDSNDLWQLQPVIVSIAFQPGPAVTFDKIYGCLFCKNATDKLLSYDKANVSKVRDFLESVKLAFIHNLNKLKRFLKQAEVDHYALYRALSYLKKCGCGDLLLRYVKFEGGPETLNVLTVLETFIKDMRQTLA